ncbi:MULTISPECIES: hypothetical protein [unclassified Amycolatopsis]|uniref:hypothetical protein n=1 Tax=unclassified Amycolatopsis TaxID=2618356 RepID=UPI001C69B6C3|nr:hypothetical protein [Amycolatopsis sp. DSM 110486]QYN20584.1 hypothetical protein K1T34_50315 [Amycolatopsis sp. DSM 110486]
MNRKWLTPLLLAVAGCSTSTTGQAHPAGGALPNAADGRNYAACADGNCEVLVTKPVDLPAGGRGNVDTLAITRIGPGGVDYELKGAHGSGSGNLTTGCVSTFYEGGGGSACYSGDVPQPDAQTGVLAVRLTGASAVGAVVQLVSGPPGPPPESLVPHIPGFGG